MKKTILVVLAVLGCAIGMVLLSGSSVIDSIMGYGIKLTAATRFLYSSDNGVSWSETVQTVYTGEPYYLAIEMQVIQSKETKTKKWLWQALQFLIQMFSTAIWMIIQVSALRAQLIRETTLRPINSML
jgi:hypothetical protein